MLESENKDEQQKLWETILNEMRVNKSGKWGESESVECELKNCKNNYIVNSWIKQFSSLFDNFFFI